MKTYLSVAFGVLAFSAVPSFAATNIVVDPGFETAPAPANGFSSFGPGQTLGGWTVVGTDPTNSIITLGTSYVEPGLAFQAHSGTTAVDLTAATNTGLTNGVFQNLATAIGETYNVSFWLGNATGRLGSPNEQFYPLASSLTLAIGDGIGQLFTNSNVTLGAVNWQRYTTSFIATSLSTKLQFNNATPSGDFYAGLDDVSVVSASDPVSAAPEPGTWMMMLLGFGMVGSALRLRGRRAIAA